MNDYVGETCVEASHLIGAKSFHARMEILKCSLGYTEGWNLLVSAITLATATLNIWKGGAKGKDLLLMTLIFDLSRYDDMGNGLGKTIKKQDRKTTCI